MRKAAYILGCLIAAYAAAISAYIWWEDPFLKKDRTLVRLGIIIPPTELPLDSDGFPD